MATIKNAEELVRRKAMELFPNSPIDQSYFMGLARQESGFNPAAYNAQGDAYGIFQFAGDMRRAYGMDTKSPIEVQLAAGGDYLKKLHAKYGGDWSKILAEHYMGLPRFNRAQAGKADAEVRSFYASHLPKVTANARRYGASPPVKDPRDITLAAAPTPSPVSSVDSVARVAQRPSLSQFLPVPPISSQQVAQRVDMLPMLLNLLSSVRQAPLVFGRGL